MTLLLASISALLASVMILLVAHGLQLTLAPLYASELGWTAQEIGYTGSAYFAGFMLGCLTIPMLVARVGHIRVFAVLTALASTAVLLLGLFDSITSWMLARALTGWAIAGVYMVIESWLNERVTGDSRGAVLSIYTILSLGAMAVGQLSVGLGLDYVTLTVVAAILFAIGVIPVGLTRSPAPPIEPVSFKLKEVFRASQVAIVCAFVAGAVNSGIWALGPIVAIAMGMATEQVGVFMAITIIGGAVVQYPVGRLSDKFDRRAVIFGLTITGALVSLLAIMIGDPESTMLVYALMFLFGGTTFPLYSLSVAHANDNTKLGIIEISSVLLLMYSTGSIFGPLIVAPLLDVLSDGLFVFSGVVLGIFALWTSWRLRVHEVARDYFMPFIGVPRTTHEIAYAYDAHIEEMQAEAAEPEEKFS